MMLLKLYHQVFLTPCTSVRRARPGTRHPVSPLGPTSAAWHVSRWALDRTHSPCETRRTQANKVKLRLKSDATGHDEGNDIVMRSVNSCTRAPSLSTWSWIVSIVAQAQGAVLNTSRRKVSRNTKSAECRNTRNELASNL